MKKQLILLFAFVLSLSFHVAHAGSGKAVVAHWLSGSSTNPSAIFVSNITGHSLLISIAFYDHNGNSIPPSTYFNFQNGNTELAPRSSGYVTITTPYLAQGYAVVSWSNKQGDDDVIGVVAHATRGETSTILGVYRYSIPINGGQPF